MRSKSFLIVAYEMLNFQMINDFQMEDFNNHNAAEKKVTTQ